MATITREPIGPLHEKISVKIDKTDYYPAFEKSLKDYSKKANIPGFRPGKVPPGMIKKMYGPSLFADEVLRSVDRELIAHLEKEATDIFAQPLPMDNNDADKLDVYNPGEYNFDFEIGLKPPFEMTDLGKAAITAYNIDVTDDMVTKEIERLQNRFGNTADIEEVAGEENILNVIFKETDTDGNYVENGRIEEASVLLRYFSEDVQKDLMGKKVGDTIIISLGNAFTEGDATDIAHSLGLNEEDATTRDKKYSVEITKIGQLEKRTLDEAFFEQLHPGGEVKTEEDLKKKTHDEIFNYWASQSRNQIHDQIFHRLIEDTVIDFPEAFLRKWLISQNSEQNSKPAKSEEDIDKDMPGFLKQLKWSLITDKIISDNSISISPDEIKDFAKKQLLSYIGGSGMPQEEEQPWITSYIDKMMQDRKYVEESYGRLQTEKVFDWAEKQIKPVSTSISAEDFTKMVSEHHHH